MREKIENALFELGITPDLKGFDYICSAVEIILSKKEEKVAILKVYEDIAKEFSTTSSRVERGIRHAFTKVKAGDKAFDKYLGITNKTNSALLHALAYKFKGGLNMPCGKIDNTYIIQKEYEVSKIHEISVDWNGYNFLIIYGKHINGWFIAIPNWEVCVEASTPTDTFYNSEKLAKALNKANAGVELAKAIKEHWEGAEK